MEVIMSSETITNPLVRGIINSILQNSCRCEGDYTGENGLLYCGKCRTPKQCYEFGEKLPCSCKCESERQAAEKAEREKRQLEEFRAACITQPTHRAARFSADNGATGRNAIEAAKWYADNFDKLFQANKGMIFTGNKGTGKTFAACCIANALIDRKRRVFVREVGLLLSDMWNTANRHEVIDYIQKPDLLILDDFGTTYNSEFKVSQLYDIINTRYTSGKPLIVTTNLTPKELNNAPSTELGRVYDRVIEMCMCEKSPVCTSGASVRLQLAAEKHKQ